MDDDKDLNEPLDLDDEAIGLEDDTEADELEKMGMHVEEPTDEAF